MVGGMPRAPVWKGQGVLEPNPGGVPPLAREGEKRPGGRPSPMEEPARLHARPIEHRFDVDHRRDRRGQVALLRLEQYAEAAPAEPSGDEHGGRSCPG